MIKLLVVTLASASLLTYSFASETLKGAKKDMENFKIEMSQKLEQTEKQLSELKETVQEKGGETQDKVVKDLENTRDELRRKLGEVDSTVNENWKKFKKNFADSLDSLNARIQKALKN